MQPAQQQGVAGVPNEKALGFNEKNGLFYDSGKWKT